MIGRSVGVVQSRRVPLLGSRAIPHASRRRLVTPSVGIRNFYVTGAAGEGAHVAAHAAHAATPSSPWSGKNPENVSLVALGRQVKKFLHPVQHLGLCFASCRAERWEMWPLCARCKPPRLQPFPDWGHPTPRSRGPTKATLDPCASSSLGDSDCRLR